MTDSPAPSTGPATYRRLLSTRGASPLFLLSFTTVLGTSLQIFAVSVVVFRVTGSAAWSSAAFAAGFLPQLVGGTLLTSLVDRWPSRPLLIAGACVRAASAAALATGRLSPAVMIGLIAVVSTVQPVPSAAQSSVVSRLLTGELYVLGRSVFNLISAGAQLGGLAVGGALITTVGPTRTFVVVTCSQLAGVVAASAVPSAPRTIAGEQRWRPSETWHGNLDLIRDAVVRRILLSWWVPLMLLVGAESLVVPYAAAVGGASAPTGLLLAAFPAGEVIGEFVIGRWCPPDLRRRAVPWLFLLVGIPLVPLAWQPGPVVAGICFLTAAAALSYQLGTQQAFVEAVPPDRRGLAFGLYGTGMMTGQGLGPAAAGLLATAIGAGPTIGVTGAGVLFAAIFLARVPPHSRTAEDSPASDGRDALVARTGGQTEACSTSL